MANIFQNNSLPQSGTGLTHIDRKRRQELREKRLVHGHKEDDHEEQQYGVEYDDALELRAFAKV